MESLSIFGINHEYYGIINGIHDYYWIISANNPLPPNIEHPQTKPWLSRRFALIWDRKSTMN